MRIRSKRLGTVALRLSGVALAGAIAAACSSGGGSASPPTVIPSGGHSSTTTTTTISRTAASLPECGATRDPLDPSGSNAPNC